MKWRSAAGTPVTNAPGGVTKSRRYQPTAPAMLAVDKSRALNALGTVTGPSRSCRARYQPAASPWSAGIGAIQPGAAEQVAARLAVAVQRPRRWCRRRGRRRGNGRRDEGHHERRGRRHADGGQPWRLRPGFLGWLGGRDDADDLSCSSRCPPVHHAHAHPVAARAPVDVGGAVADGLDATVPPMHGDRGDPGGSRAGSGDGWSSR